MTKSAGNACTPARERGKGRGRRIDMGRGESSRSERCGNSRCGRGTCTSSSYSAVDGKGISMTCK